jgi:hypothetical protein
MRGGREGEREREAVATTGRVCQVVRREQMHSHPHSHGTRLLALTQADARQTGEIHRDADTD